jgi:geranylgeranyl diphosphate synthase, type II
VAIEQKRALIERHLRVLVEEMGEKNALRDACEYALLGGGKRLRPILVLMIAEALGKDAMPAALGIECFHAASLIADDLPCMDDDAMRRERPSLHKAFGESTAILASYALIAEGYGGIYKNSAGRPDLAVICLKEAARLAGINGATNGQFLDLFPPDHSLATIQKILYQKTVTLFELAFVFGWLFGGGDPAKLDRVKACAGHLGMAFQIADDLLDEGHDRINIATALGKEKALRLFEQEMKGLQETLQELGLYSASFQEALIWLREYPKRAPAPAF